MKDKEKKKRSGLLKAIFYVSAIFLLALFLLYRAIIDFEGLIEFLIIYGIVCLAYHGVKFLVKKLIKRHKNGKKV